jgi:SAM-dependent methyltransferase
LPLPWIALLLSIAPAGSIRTSSLPIVWRCLNGPTHFSGKWIRIVVTATGTNHMSNSDDVAETSRRKGGRPKEYAIGFLHQHLVFSRRTRILAGELAEIMPSNISSILDVGCGDGTIDSLLLQSRPDLSITGVDVLVRPQTHIHVQEFDGRHLPFEDKSFDVVMFVDVLHHTDNPVILLQEAKRVARKAVVIKDHTRNGAFAYTTLRLMDWVGNACHNVALPYNYWSRSQWMQAFASIRLDVHVWKDRLGLYPPPASWIFERKLHFVVRLAVSPRQRGYAA